MASPVPPSDFKDLIPDEDADLCDKFMRFLRGFPKKFYDWYSSVYTEEGDFTDEYKDMLCEACPCDAVDDGGGTGTGLREPVIAASDGAYNDRVRITWSEVANATSYDIYRSLTNSIGDSTLIGTSTSGLYEDLTVEAGIVYFYWVKAKNATTESGFSTSDSGYASLLLDAITGLKASQGVYSLAAPKGMVTLVWAPVTGATAYDVYRGTTTTFSAAQIIASNRVPFDNSDSIYACSPVPCTQPVFTNRGDELSYIDSTVPSKLDTFYYWVKAKKLNGSQVIGASDESNIATGWHGGKGGGATFVSAGPLSVSGETYTIDAGITSIWAAVRGCGAAGGGGDAGNGGGGGGGAALVAALFEVEAGRKIRLITDPDENPAGFALGDGDDGSEVKLQYETGVGTGVYTDLIVCQAPGGGQYLAGLPGAGGTYTLHSSAVVSFAENGRAGVAKVGNKGGRGGCAFDSIRPPGNNLNGNPAQFGNSGFGSSGSGGGGSWAIPAAPTLAKGGSAQNGTIQWVTYAA